MPSKFLLHEQVRRLQQRVHNQVSTISTLQTTEREMVQRLSMSQTSEECRFTDRKQAMQTSTRSTSRIRMSERRPTCLLSQNWRHIHIELLNGVYQVARGNLKSPSTVQYQEVSR